MEKKLTVSFKRLGEILLEDHPNSFSSDFEENKKMVIKIIHLPSKSMRNKVIGYITRIQKEKAT